MKIAVIADIHANLVALRTVVENVDHWQPDRVIILGDLVNRGPRPAECLQFVMARVMKDGWLTVRGNHEEYVLQHELPDAPRHGPAFAVHQASYWTFSQLGSGVKCLHGMPLSLQMMDPNDREISFYHGSVLGLRDGIYPETPDDLLYEKIGLNLRSKGSPDLGLFCVGHTHRSLIRSLNRILVVNAGSAGLPFDLDTRAAYAQLTFNRGGWTAQIIRLSYDLDAAAADFTTSGYLEHGGPLVQLVLRELLTARSHLYTWAAHFQEPALRGEIDLEESVRRHFSAYGE